MSIRRLKSTQPKSTRTITENLFWCALKTLYLIIFGTITWPSLLIADDYPSSYITKQLTDSHKTVEVNLSHMKPGQLITVDFVGRPVWIYKRTAKDIEYLSKTNNSHLADPFSENLIPSIETSYASSASYVWARMLLLGQPKLEKLPFRSRKKQFFVTGGWSPHSGCKLSLMSPEKRKTQEAIFHDSCSDASFDNSGRILKGQLAGHSGNTSVRYNTYIPPHKFKNDEILTIGLHNVTKLPKLKEKSYLGMSPTEKLITAAKYNDLDTIQLSLAEGADAEYFAPGEGSPLDAAIIGSSMEVIELLIANGAKPTPYSLNAANFVARPEVAKLIKELQ